MTGGDDRRAAVVGAGVMGAGIALVLARAGWRVALHDRDPVALEAAEERIAAALDVLHQPVKPVLDRVSAEPSLEAAVSGARLVVEAAPERLELKQELFASLDALASPDAVLASNTSAIPIREIAARVRHRERVLGAHFWNPPHLVRLVEVVESDATDPVRVEWTMNLLAAAGLKPVHVKADVPGFVGNRLQHALKREAIALVAAGVCDAETVDTVVKEGFGARLPYLGPLEQSDLSGLPLTLAIHEVLMPSLDCTPAPHPLLVEKVRAGEHGASAGQGFRSWAPGEAAALRARVDRALARSCQRPHDEIADPNTERA
jgi:3-hydroxybutyryl-CoA dehydrogenase